MKENEHRIEEGSEGPGDGGWERDARVVGRRRTPTVVWVAVVAIAIILLGVMVLLHTSGTVGSGSH